MYVQPLKHTVSVHDSTTQTGLKARFDSAQLGVSPEDGATQLVDGEASGRGDGVSVYDAPVATV